MKGPFQSLLPGLFYWDHFNGQLSEHVVFDLKALAIQGNKNPKRKVVTENQVELLLAQCKTMKERLIVTLLVDTGIRNQEACDIRLDDIDLNERTLTIPKGKGNKYRRIGLTRRLTILLKEHLLASSGNSNPSAYLLTTSSGKAYDRWALRRKLIRISKRCGTEAINPHMLRRAMVTINAAKGRPLPILQRSCGHSSIKTTEAYCRISEQEVVNMMKDW
jgi:integrase/recombinase XerD